MQYHCGLLDEHPRRNRVLAWVSRGWWGHVGLPEEVERELRIWLSMPGFTTSFHNHTLGVCVETIRNYRRSIPDTPELRRAVGENWGSATREDAIRLACLRPERGALPALSQYRMLDDLKAGMPQYKIAVDYQVERKTIQRVVRRGVNINVDWPDWFPRL